MTKLQYTVSDVSPFDESEIVMLCDAETDALEPSGVVAAYRKRELHRSSTFSLAKPGPRACSLALAFTLLTAATPSSAVEDARPENWIVDVDLHAWVPKHEVRTTTGVDVEIGVDDVLREFDLTFQAGFKARKNRWRAFGDVLWVRLTSDDAASIIIPVGQPSVPSKISVDYEEESWIVNAGVGYNLIDEEKWTFDLLGGLRYLWLDVTVGLDLQPGLLAEPVETSESRANWDGIVAATGVIELSDRWYARYYADVGTGDTDLTWIAQGVLAYRFESLDVTAGWRHAVWNGLGGKVIKDLTLSGPIIGVRFRF